MNKEFVDLLIRVLDSFDYDDIDRALVVVEDHNGISRQYYTNEGLADLLTEIKEILSDKGLY